MRKEENSDACKRRSLTWLPIFLIFTISHSFIISCQDGQERMPAAINAQDSAAFMRSRGISTLISDSGVLRYKLVAEEWDIYTITSPPTWKFMKGMLMERFDEQFHIDLHVEADTAYLHEQKLWELRGRVVIHNVEGTLFRTEELFWDMNEHKMWSTKYMRIKTTDQELEGTDFRSNEQMTDYYVSNSEGKFPASNFDKKPNEQPTDTAAAVAATTPTNEPNRSQHMVKGKQVPREQEGHWK